MKSIKMTVLVADNPLRGLPGQTDVTITVSGEPDMPLQDGGVDEETMRQLLESPAFCAVVSMLGHVAGIAAETVVMSMARGSEQ